MLYLIERLIRTYQTLVFHYLSLIRGWKDRQVHSLSRNQFCNWAVKGQLGLGIFTLWFCDLFIENEELNTRWFVCSCFWETYPSTQLSLWKSLPTQLPNGSVSMYPYQELVVKWVQITVHARLLWVGSFGFEPTGSIAIHGLSFGL